MFHMPMSSAIIMMMLGRYCWATAIPANSSTIAMAATTVHAQLIDPTSLVLMSCLLSCISASSLCALIVKSRCHGAPQCSLEEPAEHAAPREWGALRAPPLRYSSTTYGIAPGTAWRASLRPGIRRAQPHRGRDRGRFGALVCAGQRADASDADPADVKQIRQPAKGQDAAAPAAAPDVGRLHHAMTIRSVRRRAVRAPRRCAGPGAGHQMHRASSPAPDR